MDVADLADAGLAALLDALTSDTGADGHPSEDALDRAAAVLEVLHEEAGDGSVSESLLRESGYSGEKKDKLGRRECFADGKRVPCPETPKASDDKPTTKKPAVGAAHPGAAHGSEVKVEPVKEMAAPRDSSGKIKPVPTKTPLTKQETGRVAEAVIRSYLKSVVGIKDTVALNAGKTNESIDLFGDSMAPEVKGGLCSVSEGAQQWRITFSMELGKHEQAHYNALSDEQQKAWREKRQRACLKRKMDLLKKLSQKMGRQIKPVTFTGIVNPDSRIVDIYKTDGYHQRIGWNDLKAEHVASVRYDHA